MKDAGSEAKPETKRVEGQVARSLIHTEALARCKANAENPKPF